MPWVGGPICKARRLHRWPCPGGSQASTVRVEINETDGRATGVTYVGEGDGVERHQRARAVALAGLFDRDAAAAAALGRPVAKRDARRAYAVMSGLTSAGGGMVAAAIALLPERARQGRNYHYRAVSDQRPVLRRPAVATAW